MAEEWRPIVGFPNYEVSSEGRVRRVAGYSTEGRRQVFRQGRVLKATIGSHGYPMVSLGREAKRTVHSLVAETFIGPCPEGQEVRHRDGNRENPRLENLHYGTRSDNVRDAYGHGTRNREDDCLRSLKGRRTKEMRYGPDFEKAGARAARDTKLRLYGPNYARMGFAGIAYSKGGAR